MPNKTFHVPHELQVCRRQAYDSISSTNAVHLPNSALVEAVRCHIRMSPGINTSRVRRNFRAKIVS